MPARNGTGPLGMGPMTGRGLGVCSGATAARPGVGYGFGRGGGFGGRGGGGGGRGWRNRFFATGLPGWARQAAPTEGSQPPAADLQGQVEQLGAMVAELRQRLDDQQS